ncbi:SCO family protein [Rhodocaloribacter litoris]|uniref:SCO family protein n=1 Tax=Rhodocaloribacter litoris TaxID=2558931 RepID=UPI0014203A2D|nr:SCO family protein [Rhodocaloribacter litoris]QXD14683.1 SCO family protein [Rhodocaloribacter litoris]GIV59230.1 MAG: electron transporter [Rhodothermaceae bacterium]
MLLGLTACFPDRTYEVRGRIAGFTDDPRTVLIEHEAIPGYMDAMVMPFTVAEAETTALAGLGTGDAVAFTLHVAPRRSWITGLRRLPDEAVAAHPAARQSTTPRPATAPTLVQPGDPAPPFTLVDQAGQPLRLDDYRGRALLLTFIYTRCPLPDYCPLMSRHFQALQPHLRERFGDRAQLLSISFDTAYDTPSVLREYAGRYTRDLSNWRFATGPADEIHTLATAYGVFFTPEEGSTTFAHNLTTVLIGPDGRVHRIWRGNRWQPEDVLPTIGRLLGKMN